MRINNIQNVNFNAVRFAPNSELYTSTYLTPRDKEMLKRAGELLKNTRFWDMEITAVGLRIVSKFNKDAFLEEFKISKPQNYLLRVDTVYDGHAEGCQRGQNCSFDINYGGWGTALKSHETFTNLPHVDRVAFLTEQLENKTVEGKFSKDPDGTITNKRNFLEKLFNL